MNWLKPFSKNDYNNKIGENEGKVSGITNLASAAALNTDEIHNVSDLMQKKLMM